MHAGKIVSDAGRHCPQRIVRTVGVGDAHADAAALVERELVRLPVHRRRRRKHQLAATGLLLHALHEVQSALDIVSGKSGGRASFETAVVCVHVTGSCRSVQIVLKTVVRAQQKGKRPLFTHTHRERERESHKKPKDKENPPVVKERLGDALSYSFEAGEVHARVEVVLIEHLFQGWPIQQVHLPTPRPPSTRATPRTA